MERWKGRPEELGLVCRRSFWSVHRTLPSRLQRRRSDLRLTGRLPGASFEPRTGPKPCERAGGRWSRRPSSRGGTPWNSNRCSIARSALVPATTSRFTEGCCGKKGCGYRWAANGPGDHRGDARGRQWSEGVKLRAAIVVRWRAGLRISEALALDETDLNPQRGVRCSPRQGRERRQVGPRWVVNLYHGSNCGPVCWSESLFCVGAPTHTRPRAQAGTAAAALHRSRGRCAVRFDISCAMRTPRTCPRGGLGIVIQRQLGHGDLAHHRQVTCAGIDSMNNDRSRRASAAEPNDPAGRELLAGR